MFGLYPHLITHDHYVVYGRVIGRYVVNGRYLVIIGDRAVNIVGERAESFETPLVSVFVVIGQYAAKRLG